MFYSWKGEEASLLETMQIGFRVYLASYLMASGGSLLGDKVARARRHSSSNMCPG